MIKNIKVNNLEDDARIDRWLKLKFTNITQSLIEKNLRKGIIKVNNKKVQSKYRVTSGDIVTLYDFSENKYLEKKNKIKVIVDKIHLLNFKKSIIFENNDFIIINKWSGISCQRGSGIKFSIDDIIKSISSDYKLVHRLDKDTSGLLIISKNIKSARIFGNLFTNRKIYKVYIGFCNGTPKKQSSKIEFFLKDKKKNNLIKTLTKYKLLQHRQKISMILFQPLTGKKHQIRILSKNINCPIIGDNRYNKNRNFISENLKLNACYLSFKFNNKEYNFHSVLPKDFNLLIKKYEFKFDYKNSLIF